MIWLGILLLLLFVTGYLFMQQAKFGKLPQGARLERIKKSPNYRDGQFQNQHETYQFNPKKGIAKGMWEFLTDKQVELNPQNPLPVIKTNLKNIDLSKDQLVWFGHSSYLMVLAGKTFLVDPVFLESSPVKFLNKAFKGTEVFGPDDMPNIDYLIITHDHWDHLDYQTFQQLKPRIAHIITALGVASHLEGWGYDTSRISEMDWNETVPLSDGFSVHCLPARHFSGRGLSRNKTLWASFLVQAPTRSVYVGGDSGYDTHYAEIGKSFPNIDLAIMENGQYNEDWNLIHIMPNELVQAARETGAKRILTVHNSKFPLAKHPWYEPLEKIYVAAQHHALPLLTPKIGETIWLDDPTQTFTPWWRNHR